ncbi:Deoxyribodipyrimidine photo-lyase-related protein [Pseudoruegeria aquimaris]|uniref:Deoxyribodipyrimidine photo-lyase-related protein n=1 Tax=Pseudoruegeria aquimaris TaxID=393663 RepID=A0A1Y5REL5_9RHOB|nr:cryptochrome/photolyase family protein [Pseudoruegeria aquimaris]SLN15640.1 Deoxyribodipyrimidine photo-lyase-related protein [Pseudoruegeria aquimaris]
MSTSDSPRLVLVLGDQLSPGLSALKAADKRRDVVVMAEVAAETGYVPHHPKKIAFILAAMRRFAARLEAEGWRLRYTRLDGDDPVASIPEALLAAAQATGAQSVLATRPGEWRLIEALEEMPLEMHLLEDDRFICAQSRFAAWAEGRKSLRMEYFYREMRRETGLLMEGGKPAGGKWNYDHDNRKPAKPDLFRQGPRRFAPDETTRAVIAMVNDRFSGNFGSLDDFWFATDAAEAQQAFAHFLAHGLPGFGETQDAMLKDDPFLNHAMIGLYLNAGLLDPLEVCRAAEAEYAAGRAPLNSVEGFIRQILGWREFIRGVYFLEGPGYTRRNALGHTADLPAAYWGGETRMACIKAAVGQTEREAYAHHIQRLMITGNFALLAGVDPAQVHEWYLSVYADAFEWVEAPNTLGMSQFADGGVVGSKPYVSSGAYIDRMSDYCKSCAYDVKAKKGEGACPFNLLYWHFLNRHRERFAGNPRMAQMYRTWERMDAGHRAQVLREGDALLARLEAGAPV